MDDIYIGIVEKLDYFGNGIVKNDDMIVFIPGVLKGEQIKYSLVKKKKRSAIGAVVQIIEKSKDRVDSKCLYNSVCGGCDLGFINYHNQLLYKENVIKELFDREFGQGVKINSILPTQEFNYRNKVTLHVENKKVGLYEKSSKIIVPIDECLLLSKSINKLIPRVREFIKESSSDIKSIVIKSNLIGDILISFYGEVNEEELLNDFSDITSIYVNDCLIKDDSSIKELLNGFTFNISNKSFFQVNSVGASILYNEVIRHVKNNHYDSLLDFYCGTGTIGILTSKYVNKVIGIDSEKDAINDAENNAKLSGIKNIDFINDRVENCINRFKDIDAIIVDPPRDGLHKNAVLDIIRIKPKSIVYVSCNPITLIRDLNLLEDFYKIIEVTPVDMFSNTHHVECVVLLQKKNS